MPRNNSLTRRNERKRDAQTRWVAGNDSGKSVAEREAERGYPAKLNAQNAATTQ